MTGTHGDSPTRPKHTHTAEYRSAHVADCRAALMRDIPEVPEVTLTSLMNGVLPTVSSEVLKSTYEKLIEIGHIKDWNTDNPRWSCLPQNPKTSPNKEDVTFKFLETIAQVIASLNRGSARLNTNLKVAGQISPAGLRHNTSRPDGYFVIEDTTRETVQWADIVMPMEFKNNDSKNHQGDDFAKVMWSMHHIMRNDPRRRYVHGLTCEDTKARLWFNNRSDVIVSKKFDINKNWKHLVRIILSIQVASLVDLGYDPDVKVVPTHGENSEPSYDIAIYNPDTKQRTVYRTVGIISDVGTDSMVGRGTRVWKVQKLKNGRPDGPIYALKDVWVNEDRDPEHKILQKIRELQPEYSQYFLTPIDYGFAPLDSATLSTPESTHRILGRPRNLKVTQVVLRIRIVPPGSHTSESQSQKTPSVSRHSVGQSEDIPDSNLEGYRDFGYLSKHARLHYRVVFKEIGDAIHNLRHFSKVFTAIQGGWEGLHAIHLSSYVHRDVSSGNILLVPGSSALPERGVIMDLEYGKAIDDTKQSHDVKTGTVAFMATEVAQLSHHRLETLRNTDPNADPSTFMPSEESPTSNDNIVRMPLPPFRHNPLHDMESIWWLCLWIMFYLVPSTTQSSKAQQEGYHKIFRNPAVEREAILCHGRLESNAPHLWDISVFADELKRWANHLNACYSKSYKRYVTSTDSLETIRIDEEMITQSYEAGKRFLARLKKCSEILPECVTLSEQHQDVATTRTTETTDSEVIYTVLMDCVLLDLPRKRKQSSNEKDAISAINVGGQLV